MIESETVHLEWTDFDGWPWQWSLGDNALQSIGEDRFNPGIGAHYHGTTTIPCEGSDFVGRLDREENTAIIRRGIDSNKRDRVTDDLLERLYRIIQKEHPGCSVFYFPYGDRAYRMR